MNKVYKVVWNVTLGTWTAVSELAKGKTKTSAKMAKNISTIVSILGVVSFSPAVFSGYEAGGGRTFTNCTTSSGSGTEAAGAIAISGDNTSAGACAPTQNSIAIGAEASTSANAGTNGYNQSIAIGNKTIASGDQSIALGANTTASGNSSIVIGGDDLDKVAGKGATLATSNTTAAAKTYNELTGDQLLRSVDGKTGPTNQYYGTSAGEAAIAIGVQAGATGDLSTAFGTRSSATGVTSVALGVGSTANKDGAIALGAGSKTDQNATKVTNATIENITLANFVGTNGFSGIASDAGRQVSVGNVGNERQIKNVAPGEVSSKSTDAINGSQLNALATVLSDAIGAKVTPEKDPLGNIITDPVTGNASYIIDNLGGTGQNNINDAIQYVNNNTQQNTTAINQLQAGWTLNANGANSSAIRAGDTVDIGTEATETNLQVKKAGNTIDFSLNKNLTVDSLTAGGTTVNNNGLSIVNGPSVLITGIDAGSKTISNVAAGTVSATSQDAVNAAQLYNSQLNLANVIGGATTIDSNGNVIVGDIANTGKTTISDAIQAAKNTVSAGSNIVVDETKNADGSTNYQVHTAKDLKVDSVQAGDSTLSTNGLTFQTLDTNGNVVDSGILINAQGINAGNTVITNLKDGAVNATSQDAVNGSQLFQTDSKAQTALDTANKGFALKAQDGNSVQKALGEAVDVVGANSNIKTKVQNGQVQIELADSISIGSITAGGNTLNAAGLTIGNTLVTSNGITVANGPSLTVSGIDAGNQIITNVANGTVSGTSSDAVNGSQLHGAQSNIANVIGGNAAVNNAGDVTVSNIGGTGKNTISEAVAAAKTTVTQGDNIVVTPTTNADGSMNYEVKTAANMQVSSITAGNALLSNDGLTIISGPSVVTSGINAGGKTITNVADGSTLKGSTEAVNGGQLYDLSQTIENLKTLTLDPSDVFLLSSNGNDETSISKGDKIDIGTANNEKNIKVNKSSNTIDFSLNPDLDVTSVSAGGTIVDNKGVHFVQQAQLDDQGNPVVDADGNPVYVQTPSISRTGIDAGNTVITNVKDGAVNASSKEAVNGSQLYKTDTKAQTALDTANKGFALTAQDTKTVSKQLGESVEIVGANKNISTLVQNGQIQIELGKDLTVDSITAGGNILNSNGLTVGNSSVTSNGLSIVGGPSVLASGIDAGNKKITHVAKGDVTAASEDAVNGSQLYNAQSNVKNVIGDAASINPQTGEITVSNLGGTGKNNIDDAIKAAQTKVVQGKNIVVNSSVDPLTNQAIYEVNTADDLQVNSIKAGNNTVLNNSGLTLLNGPSVLVTGIDAGKKKITNVAKGDVTTASEDAVNGSQLYNAQNNVANIIGGNTVIDPATGSVSTSNIGGTGKNTIDEAIKASTTTVSQGKNMVVTPTKNADGSTNYEVKTSDYIDAVSFTAGNTSLTNNGLSILNGPSVTISGINAGGKVISNLANGAVNATSSDAVNGSQLYAVDSRINQILNNNIAALEQGFSLSANGLDTAAVVAGATIDIGTAAGESNLTVSKSGNIIDFALNPDLILTSVTAGGSLLNNDGLSIANGPQILTTGINAAKKKITNVAKGDVTAASEDAVNGSQLYNAQNNVANVIGGNTVIDPNTGAITANDIGGTGKNTVNEAVAAAKTVVKQGDNIVVDESKDPVTGNSIYTVKTAQDLKVNSVQAGSTILNTQGLSFQTVDASGNIVKTGPSIQAQGIDAGKKKITNVAKGDVTAASEDAVNGSQLYNAQNNVANLIGGSTTIDPNTGAVSSNNIGGTGKNTIDAAVAAAKTTVSAGQNIVVDETKNADGSSNYQVHTADDLIVNSVVANTIQTGNSTLSNLGLQINGGPSITLSGIDAGSKKITNVANGSVNATSSDAVNGSQLYAVDTRLNDIINKNITALEQGFSLSANGQNTGAVVAGGTIDIGTAVNEKNITVSKSGNIIDFALNPELVVDSVTAGNTLLNNDGLTLANGPSVLLTGINAGNKKITRVAKGDVTAASEDAVNGSQLYNAQNNVANVIGSQTSIDPNTGVITANNIGGTGKNTVSEAVAAAKTVVKQGDNIVVDESKDPVTGNSIYTVKTAQDLNVSSVTAGSSLLNNDGLTLANGPSVLVTGIDAAKKKITHVAKGDVTAASEDAVNGSQLYNAQNNVANIIGGNTVIDPATGSVSTSNIGGTGKNTIDEAIKASTTTVSQGKNMVVTPSKNADGSTNYEVKTSDYIDAVSFTAGNTSLNNNGLSILNGPSVLVSGINAGGLNISNVANGVALSDAVNVGQLNAVDSRIDQILNQNIANLNQGFKLSANGQQEAAVVAGATIDIGTAQGETNLTVSKSSNVIDFALNPNLILTSVTAGGTLLNNDGLSIVNGPQILTTGINAGKKKITNVAKGDVTAVSEDAVNGSQLYNAQNNVSNVIGGQTSIDPNTGAITANNIGGTGKNTVSEAVAAAKTVVKQGDNIVVDESKDPVTGNSIYTVKTAQDLKVNSLAAGNTLVNNNGLSINNGPSVTISGIDAGKKKITNVAKGDVTSTSTDAVNGSQLYNAQNNVANMMGGNTVIDPNTGLITANNIGGTGKNTVNEAVAAAKTEVVEGKNIVVKETKDPATGHSIYEVSTDENLKVTSLQAGNTLVNNNGLVINNGPSITVSGINAGDKKITNVANGDVNANSADAVNGSQLYAVDTRLNDIINKNITALEQGFSLSANGQNTGAVVAGGTIDIGTALNEKNITVSKSGNIIDFALNPNLVVDSVTAGNSVFNTSGLSLNDANGATTVIGSDGSIVMSSGGNTVALNAATGDLTGLSNKTLGGNNFAQSGRAATEEQLNAAQSNLTSILGGNAANNGGVVSMSNIGGTGENTIDAAIKSVNQIANNANQGWTVSTNGNQATASNVKPGNSVDFSNTDGNVVIANQGNNLTVNLNKDQNLGKDGSLTVGDTQLDNSGLTIAGGPSITNSGIDAGNKQVTNVEDGKIAAGSKDAVNGGQIQDMMGAGAYDANGNLSNIGGTGANNINDAIQAVNKNIADNKVSVKAGSDNVTVSSNTNGTEYTVDISKDLNVNSVTAQDIKADTITAGNTTINSNGVSIKDGPSMTASGVDAGNKAVSNVSNGVQNSDAVNMGQMAQYLGGGAGYNNITQSFDAPNYEVNGGSYNNVGDALGALNQADQALGNRITNLGDQLQQAFYSTNKRIDDVEKKANAGIAAAMSLENAPYVPGKYTYAVGAAYHGGENAVGATLRKTADNGRWSLTGGVAAGSSGDPSVRVGISGVID